jgi:hypothetical protein
MYAGMQGIRRKKIKNPVDKYCIYVYNNTQMQLVNTKPIIDWRRYDAE